jgi:flagellin-like hook-associated protein FlgL
MSLSAISPLSPIYAMQVLAYQENRALQRLSTGKAVSSPLDNAPAYFLSLSEDAQASMFQNSSSQIGQDVSTLQASQTGLQAVQDTLSQMKAMGQMALASSDPTVRSSYAVQYDTMRQQLDEITVDTSYNGVNLINSTPSNLVVSNGGPTGSTTQVQGQASDSNALGVAPSNAWGGANGAANIQNDLSTIDTAITTVRTTMASLTMPMASLQTRQQFNDSMAQTLTDGASYLVASDTYVDAASVLSVSTQRQLANQAYARSMRNQQSVLALFR